MSVNKSQKESLVFFKPKSIFQTYFGLWVIKVIYEDGYFKQNMNQLSLGTIWCLFNLSFTMCTYRQEERVGPMTVLVDMPGGNMHQYDLDLLFYLAELSPDLISIQFWLE